MTHFEVSFCSVQRAGCARSYEHWWIGQLYGSHGYLYWWCMDWWEMGHLQGRKRCEECSPISYCTVAFHKGRGLTQTPNCCIYRICWSCRFLWHETRVWLCSCWWFARATHCCRTLCMLLDSDKNGRIDLDEFVSGCMQLHGPAKSLQLAKMSFENKLLVWNSQFCNGTH